MKDIKKYQGVIPAFYACYDAEGNISVEGVKALTRHLIAKGVKGVYVGGSSGECIYQHVDERKTVLEAARIDGASEARTFVKIVLPMVKPGIGALAIFTFINSWNDYFMQLIMLSSTSNLTISLGIAKLQAENSTDFGLIMAGAALAAVPIIIIFLIFQKYFTKGIAMGAVKG